MIESEMASIMSGLIRSPGQSHRPSTQEYRVLGCEAPHPSEEEDLPSDLQSLSWLTSVDVPRLQQMATQRADMAATHSQNPLVLQHNGSLSGNIHAAGAPGAMIHIQASLPQGILGLNAISSHAANVNRYVVGGQISPDLRPPQTPLFAPPAPPTCHAQQVFAITPQCSPGAVYSAPYATQPPYSQPRLAPHASQELHAKHYPKPIYSYSCLIAMALKNSKTGSLPVSEIYSFMKEHFPYFKTAPDGWKNSVRHNLSLNKCFEKVENKLSGTSRKGCLWALNPAKIDKMEEEMQKWKRKDLAAIHRSMANPEELDKLITDRPENCRRPGKMADADVSVRLSQPQRPPPPPPTAMTLSLPQPSMPMHHQACMAPDSPSPTQTPPSHALRNGTPGPLAQQQQQHPSIVTRGHDFLGAMMADVNAEVDALDPSIMDFALQGNIWEEMKDESFNLESLGAFGNSPLPLSDCGLAPVASGGGDHSFPDLQVTGLYAATYAALDTVASSSSSAPYFNAPGSGKPITLL